MSAHLSVSALTKRYGQATALDAVGLVVRQGEFVALLGPSGCGKTTLLRCLAGLLDPDEGRIELGGEDITRRPAWDRDIGLVFQNYALFPHMSVRQNVAFGLQMRGIRGAEAGRRVDEALDIVAMRDFGARRPGEMSGGQQQRVAIARAIAIRPRLLLLDEPLSNLDAVLRQTVRVELRELHERTGLTTIMVTHDQAEALTLADRVALMQAGRLLQFDPPELLYERPGSPFAAGFIGAPPANLLPVARSAEGVSLAGRPWTPPPAMAPLLAGLAAPALLAVRPEALALVAVDTPGAIPGRLKAVEYMGAERLAHVEIGAGEAAMTAVARASGPPGTAGDAVALLPRVIAGLFDAATGTRIGEEEASDVGER